MLVLSVGCKGQLLSFGGYARWRGCQRVGLVCKTGVIDESVCYRIGGCGCDWDGSVGIPLGWIKQ